MSDLYDFNEHFSVSARSKLIGLVGLCPIVNDRIC